MSEAIERKRAIRSANRGVLTKYMKEAIEHMSGEMDQSKLDRLTTLNKLLNEKLALVINSPDYPKILGQPSRAFQPIRIFQNHSQNIAKISRWRTKSESVCESELSNLN